MWIFTIQKPQRASLWCPRHGETIVSYFTPFLPDSFSSLWVSRSSTTWPMWAKWSPSDICLSRICGQFKMNCMAKVNEVKSFTFWWSIKIKLRNETSFACAWFQLLLCDYEGKEAETNMDLCPRVKWKPDCLRNPILRHPCIPPGVCSRMAVYLMWPQTQWRANKPRSDSLCWQGNSQCDGSQFGGPTHPPHKSRPFCSRFFCSLANKSQRSVEYCHPQM